MKYIVFCEERSDGPQCNTDHVWLVESKTEPTKELIERNSLMSTGYCTNVSYPGCEDCAGSHVESFRVEPFTPQKAKELGLIDEPYESTHRDNYLITLK